MRARNENRDGAASIAPLRPLGQDEALGCRASGKPIRHPFDPIITLPPPPAPPVIVPLPDPEALACVGGDDFNPVKQLIDWILGKPPDPDQWPPTHF